MNLLVVYDETRHPKVSFKIFCVCKFQAGNILQCFVTQNLSYLQTDFQAVFCVKRTTGCSLLGLCEHKIPQNKQLNVWFNHTKKIEFTKCLVMQLSAAKCSLRPQKMAVFCKTNLYCAAYSYTSENVTNSLVVQDETRHFKVSFKIFCVQIFQAGNILQCFVTLKCV